MRYSRRRRRSMPRRRRGRSRGRRLRTAKIQRIGTRF